MAEIPQHYNINGIDDTMRNIIKIVNHNAKTNEEAIYLFNTLKYLYRYGCKNGVKDLKKAEDYLSRLIQVKEKEKEKGEN